MDMEFDIKQVTNNVVVQVKPDGIATLPSLDACGFPVSYVTNTGVTLIPMKLQLQKVLDGPPAPLSQLYSVATRSDGVTNTSWNSVWINQALENGKKYNMTELTCMSEFGKEKYKPVIIAGSGPSIKKNYMNLRKKWVHKQNLDTGKMEYMVGGGRDDIKIVSCLHNFGLFENEDVMTKDDYYMTLDAGAITITETIEGGSGKHPPEWYWERTKDRTLLTHLTANPELLAKWQGRILFFTTPAATEEVKKAYDSVADCTIVPSFSVGGNALGACLYFARAILGAGPVIFIGADFSFSYEQKFHGWDSPYDQKFMGVEAVTDIYGNRCYTWPSYYGFKCWLDYIACGGAGGQEHDFYNCTEGGILGAYPEGNIRQFRYMPLTVALNIFTCHEKVPTMTKNTKTVPMVLY